AGTSAHAANASTERRSRGAFMCELTCVSHIRAQCTQMQVWTKTIPPVGGSALHFASMRKPAMPRKKKESELRLCPAIGFSQIVGGKYKLRILWALNKRSHRYGEIRRSLLKGTLGKAVTPRVLSRELKELRQRGLIDRKQFDVVPPKVEYTL